MNVHRLPRTVWLPFAILSMARAEPLLIAPGALEGGALSDPAASLQDPAPFTLGLGLTDLPLEPAPDPRADWFVRLEYALPSSNSLGDIVTGEVTLLDNNESYCLTVGRYLKRDLWGLPLDLSLNGSVCFHPSNAQQEDFFQYLLWIQLQWTSFPWDEHLRTKVGLGEGLSYVEHIPYSEIVRREGRDSLHLLNYLEFSVSLNLADLLKLTRLSRILPGADSPVLEDAWLSASLHHRSGGRGLFGDYEDDEGNSHPMTGGDNVFTLGLTVGF